MPTLLPHLETDLNRSKSALCCLEWTGFKERNDLLYQIAGRFTRNAASGLCGCLARRLELWLHNRSVLGVARASRAPAAWVTENYADLPASRQTTCARAIESILRHPLTTIHSSYWPLLMSAPLGFHDHHPNICGYANSVPADIGFPHMAGCTHPHCCVEGNSGARTNPLP